MERQNRPIILWMTSRSRSSMVSQIFARHGVFWGDTQKQSAGYDTYENQNIKALQKKVFGGLRTLEPMIKADVPKIKEFLRELSKYVPAKDTWLMKTGCEFFGAFLPLNPYNVFIYRDPIDVAKSLCTKRPEARWPRDKDATLETINWRYDYMRHMQDKNGGVSVNTDNIIAGDFSEIKEAIEYCGLEYNLQAVEKSIRN